MSEKININVADVAALTTISGIGPALAERIVVYRQTVHPFEEVIELAAVPGISEKMVRGFEVFVTVGEVGEATAVPTQQSAPEETLLLDAPAPPDGLLPAEVAPAAPESDPVAVEELPVAEAEPEPEMVEESAIVAARVETAVVPSPPAPEPSPPQREATPEPHSIAPPPQNGDWEAKAQRRGCVSTLLGATFGAILGAVLTLAILAALNNGSLTFAESDAAIRQQLDTEIISRTQELNQLTTRVSFAATEEAASNQALQDEFTTANQTLNAQMADNEENISYLATRSGDLELRLEEVAGAADTFTAFLDGLRGLLNDLEIGTPTPAPLDETVTPTPTPFGSNTPTVEPEATMTAVPPTETPTGAPTRTPQPTATPFTFPTNTPAPQP